MLGSDIWLALGIFGALYAVTYLLSMKDTEWMKRLIKKAKGDK